MPQTMAGPQPLPVARHSVFDPPTQLGELREHEPLSRLRFPDGHLGWLVTSHDLAREVLADQRFSAWHSRRSPVIARRFPRDQPRPGFFLLMDPPEHTRLRRLLTGLFTVRRMRQLEPRISQIVDAHLDAMVAIGPPADLVQSFALPVPSQVICELLGVPYTDRARFQRDSATLLSLEATTEQVEAAAESIHAFLAELVALRRAEPDEAMISGLIATGELTDEEIAGIGMLLLVAGHETTANMLALGTFVLLCHPDQLAALRADPALINGAVEELLRYLTIVQFGPVRGALEDVELHGHVIEAGNAVCISLPAANRDPATFADPETLDVSRSASGHLAFGHGIHQCLGQQLARVEMRVGFAALLRRLPALRLAVEPRVIPMRDDMGIYGVHELPIAWDTP